MYSNLLQKSSDYFLMRSGKAKYSNFVKKKTARYIFLTVRFLDKVRKLPSLKPPKKKSADFWTRFTNGQVFKPRSKKIVRFWGTRFAKGKVFKHRPKKQPDFLIAQFLSKKRPIFTRLLNGKVLKTRRRKIARFFGRCSRMTNYSNLVQKDFLDEFRELPSFKPHIKIARFFCTRFASGSFTSSKIK